MANAINHFPQASAIERGVRLSDYTDAPINAQGKPEWWVLRPDLVFAYLESPPSFLHDDGKGGAWQWPSPLSNSLRALFDQARTNGLSVSAAVSHVDPGSSHLVELTANEDAARQAIQTGVFDTQLGKPVDRKLRGALASRAGLSAGDVNGLSQSYLDNAPKTYSPPRRINPALAPVYQRAFGQMVYASTPTSPLVQARESALAIVGFGLVGLGAVLGVVWGVKELR